MKSLVVRGGARPDVARTQADGSFGYPTKPKGIGIYTLELRERFLARLAGDLPEAGTGPVVCKRLDGGSDVDVVITAPATTFDLQVSNATQVGGSASTDFLALKSHIRRRDHHSCLPGRHRCLITQYRMDGWCRSAWESAATKGESNQFRVDAHQCTARGPAVLRAS